MTIVKFTESVVEDAALAWLESLGYTIKHLPAPQNVATRQAGGPEIVPVEFLAERAAPVAKSATTQLRSKFGKGNCFQIGNSSAFGLLMCLSEEDELATTEDYSAVQLQGLFPRLEVGSRHESRHRVAIIYDRSGQLLTRIECAPVPGAN
ncbi:MAG: hypothetical protein ACREO5_11635 [Candidatus Binatia bacterium]